MPDWGNEAKAKLSQNSHVRSVLTAGTKSRAQANWMKFHVVSDDAFWVVAGTS